MIEGDKICKSLNTTDYLAFDELPKQIQIYNRNVDVGIEVQNLHEGIASHGEPFLQNIVNVFHNLASTGYLLLICSYAIAIILNYDRNDALNSLSFYLIPIAEIAWV